MENIAIKINLNRIKENYGKISKYIQPFKVIPVLKADAYGHGIEEVSKLFDKINTICVNSVEEGIKVRSNSNAKIICLSSPKAEDIKYLKENQIMPTVFLKEHADILKECKEDCLINVEINTGMGRSGTDIMSGEEFIQMLLEDGFNINSVFTHIYDSYNLDEINRQIEELKCISKGRYIHTNGSSILKNEDALRKCDVRIGRALFGLTGSLINDKLGLLPALKLVVKIGDIFIREKGEGIGYISSNRSILERKTKIGLINVGYSSGIPINDRVYIGEKCVPIIGGINMTNFCIDLTEVDNAYVGQEVVLIDDDYSSENSVLNIANRNGLNVNQIVCNLNSNIEKIYN